MIAMAIALGLVCGSAPIAAQSVNDLEGQITDSDMNQPVAGAEIQVIGEEDRTTQSGDDGEWSITGLPAGEYTVAVTAPGYVPRNTEVRLPRDASLDFTLFPQPYSLNRVVVTASRRVQRLADVPVSTEVIARDEIRRTGASDLGEVVRKHVGIVPSGAGVSMQGFSPTQVLVLVDGQPFIGRVGRDQDLSRIPTSNIERIEIIKGPMSTLYGSEAMGGVINVITRTPTTGSPRITADLTTGSQERLDGALGVETGLGAVSVAANLGRRDRATAPGRSDGASTTDKAGTARVDASTRLRWAPDSDRNVEIGAFLVDEEITYQVRDRPTFIEVRQFDVRAAGSYANGGHRLSPSLQYTGFDRLFLAASEDQEMQQLFRGELLYGTSFGSNTLDVGLEAERETVESGRVGDVERRQDGADAFAQWTWSGQRVDVVPGARLSWSETWGANLTPRLATLYRPSPALALRASAGLGYRAPSLRELHLRFFGQRTPLFGNPDLAPEHSRNVSAGAEWSTGPVYLRGELFHNRYDDLIEYEAFTFFEVPGDSSSGIRALRQQNVAEGMTQGVELEGGLAWGSLRGEAGYGYLDTEDLRTGESLLSQPSHTGRLFLGYEFPFGLQTGLTGTYTGATPLRRTDEGLEKRAAWMRYDLQAAHPLPGGLMLTLGVDNLLDREIEDWPGFTGRHVYLRASWNSPWGGP